MQVFSPEARREMNYYIMPRETYPHGMLTSQVLQGLPPHIRACTCNARALN